MPQPTLPKAFAVKRIIAFIYDLLLIVPLMMVSVLAWLPFNQGIAIEPGNPLYPFMIITCAILTPTAFYAYFWHKGGQTLGMQSWRLKAVTINGNSLTIKQSSIRAISFILSIAIIYFGLEAIYSKELSSISIIGIILSVFAAFGLLSAFLPRRTSLIDRLTKTSIVQLPKTKK